MSTIAITSDVSIQADELSVVFSRSSGPGGQNVNKVSTRATVLFDVALSPSLTDEQKRKIRERLATRVSGEGVLRVSSQRERSQSANRAAARERRVAAKKLRGARKRDRGARPVDEE